MTKIEELEAKVKELQEKIEEMKTEAKKKIWPHSMDEYWYIRYDGEISSSTWTDMDIDEFRLSIGNVFHTREDAKFASERLKVIHELKEFAEPEDAVWNSINKHYDLLYDTDCKAITIDNGGIYRRSGIYFESEEKAMEAINAVGEDRIIKYYLEVKL